VTLRRKILILFGSFFEKHSNTSLNYLTFLGRFLNIVKLHKTHKGENKTMEKNKDNDLRWLSIKLSIRLENKKDCPPCKFDVITH